MPCGRRLAAFEDSRHHGVERDGRLGALARHDHGREREEAGELPLEVAAGAAAVGVGVERATVEEPLLEEVARLLDGDGAACLQAGDERLHRLGRRGRRQVGEREGEREPVDVLHGLWDRPPAAVGAKPCGAMLDERRQPRFESGGGHPQGPEQVGEPRGVGGVEPSVSRGPRGMSREGGEQGRELEGPAQLTEGEGGGIDPCRPGRLADERTQEAGDDRGRLDALPRPVFARSGSDEPQRFERGDGVGPGGAHERLEVAARHRQRGVEDEAQGSQRRCVEAFDRAPQPDGVPQAYGELLDVRAGVGDEGVREPGAGHPGEGGKPEHQGVSHAASRGGGARARGR